MIQRTKSNPYDQTFFDRLVDRSLASARAVVPTVLKPLPITSVVDFGCGRGAWLKAFLENGVETVLGLDGDYVDTDRLLIDADQFRGVDLRRPIALDRCFDLALCLEVAEHLPARSASTLIKSLAAAAPVVLFSAALPGQGGISHINEQWPLYWERLFAGVGMRKFDVVRPLTWNNSSIDLYYRQNIYIFSRINIDALEMMEQFEDEFCLVSEAVMSNLTFRWSSLALKFMPILQTIHSCVSRLTPNR